MGKGNSMEMEWYMGVYSKETGKTKTKLNPLVGGSRYPNTHPLEHAAVVPP